MKLRPTQIVGLAAILVFGSYLVIHFIQGPRDPGLLPSGVRISELPTISAPPLDTAPIPADPLLIGSETARDDLYCSGVVFAAHRSKPEDSLSEDAQKQRDVVIALAEAGAAKLKMDGVATDATTGAFADAHSEKAAKDFAAGKTRISFEECMARAAIPGAPN